MATDNKQKVLIRSMSTEELMNYLCTSDLNGKITPKNEDTWHQNYDYINDGHAGSILSNESKTQNYCLFFNRTASNNVGYKLNLYLNKAYVNYTGFHVFDDFYIKNYFRPLIEYKE